MPGLNKEEKSSYFLIAFADIIPISKLYYLLAKDRYQFYHFQRELRHAF